MRQRQQGMTMIGMLFVLGLVGVILYGGIRVAPLYLNYMKVARSMEATASEFKTENPEIGGMRRSLEKHWQIEDINSVEAKDVDIEKDEGGVTMHVAYDDSSPYISNLSLTMHFDKTVKVQ
jgi:type II secretory pathway pseudopilin PulG